LAYSAAAPVALRVGFYYVANACGRLLGTLLSGLLYQLGGRERLTVRRGRPRRGGRGRGDAPSAGHVPGRLGRRQRRRLRPCGPPPRRPWPGVAVVPMSCSLPVLSADHRSVQTRQREV